MKKPLAQTHPNLARFAQTPVKEVAKSGGPQTQELFDFAARGQKDWHLQEWKDLLHALDHDERTVAEYTE